jgi:hypothetical protein
MTECFVCGKTIKVYEEPKLKFTRLGSDYFHSKCYLHIHEIQSLVSYT